MKGWVFVSVASVMLALSIVTTYLMDDGHRGAVLAALGLLLGLMAMAEFSKTRNPDRDGLDEGEKHKGRRWRESRYGLHHELAGARRRRRRRYRRG